jgi:hypothetical protein
MAEILTPPAWLFLTTNILWLVDIIMLFGIYRVTRPLVRRQHSSFIVGSLTVVLWHIAAIYSTKSEVFLRFPLPIVTIASVIVSYLLFTRVRPLVTIIDSMPMHWFVLIQFFRVFGGVLLVLYAQGYQPGTFAVPAGVGDVFIGLTALWVTLMLVKQSPIAGTAARWWAIGGIVDLVVAISMGVLTSPFAGGNNILISIYPLAIIPAFRVPFMFTLHLVLLRRLRRVDHSVVKSSC